MKTWIPPKTMTCLGIHPSLCCAGRKARELENQKINQLLVINIPEPTHLKWASLMVFVVRKGWNICFCVDNCKLKAVTILDSYPITCMTECTDFIAKATIYVRNRMPIAGSCRPKLPRKMDSKPSLFVITALYGSPVPH